MAAGARLHTSTTVTDPLLGGRVTGVAAKSDGTVSEFRAPVVVAASGRRPGCPSRWVCSGIPAGPSGWRCAGTPGPRPGSTTATWRSTSNCATLTGDDGPLPGYGWIFGLGDGRVNVGLAIHDSGGRLHTTATTAGSCGGGLRRPRRSGASPTSTTPTGRCSAPRSRWSPLRERALGRYAHELDRRHGGYYRLGRAFVRFVDDPRMWDAGLRRLLPHRRAMSALLRLVTRLTDSRGGPTDRLIELTSTLARVVRARER